MFEIKFRNQKKKPDNYNTDLPFLWIEGSAVGNAHK